MRQKTCPWESSAFANSDWLSISFQKKLFETAAASSKTLTGSPRRERNVPVSSKHNRSFAASLFHLITCDADAPFVVVLPRLETNESPQT